MSTKIGPKEAAQRALREANYEASRKAARPTPAELKTAIAAVPAKKPPKAKKKRT